jgi:hypothetical protein
LLIFLPYFLSCISSYHFSVVKVLTSREQILTETFFLVNPVFPIKIAGSHSQPATGFFLVSATQAILLSITALSGAII